MARMATDITCEKRQFLAVEWTAVEKSARRNGPLLFSTTRRRRQNIAEKPPLRGPMGRLEMKFIKQILPVC